MRRRVGDAQPHQCPFRGWRTSKASQMATLTRDSALKRRNRPTLRRKGTMCFAPPVAVRFVLMCCGSMCRPDGATMTAWTALLNRLPRCRCPRLSRMAGPDAPTWTHGHCGAYATTKRRATKLSGQCGMCYEEKLCEFEEADRMRNHWLRKWGRCGASTILWESAADENRRRRRRNKIGDFTTTRAGKSSNKAASRLSHAPAPVATTAKMTRLDEWSAHGTWPTKVAVWTRRGVPPRPEERLKCVERDLSAVIARPLRGTTGQGPTS